jgi:transposase-like protein
MQNGICPHCGATTIFMQKNGIQFGESSGVYVYVSSAASLVAINSYVCTSCGYFQNFVANTETLAQLSASGKWKRVELAA